MRVVAVLLALCLTTSVRAWTTPTVNRQDFLKTAGVAAASWFLSPALPATAAVVETMPNGIKKEVVKVGTGPQPVVGELVAIRFSAYAGDNKIDDIFGTPEPYYTRMGSGNLIKGVEETLPLMKVGDRWLLTIPVRDCRNC
jgi:FKBP-type peptidyl-prolyl cis-trans isomerase